MTGEPASRHFVTCIEPKLKWSSANLLHFELTWSAQNQKLRYSFTVSYLTISHSTWNWIPFIFVLYSLRCPLTIQLLQRVLVIAHHTVTSEFPFTHWFHKYWLKPNKIAGQWNHADIRIIGEQISNHWCLYSSFLYF